MLDRIESTIDYSRTQISHGGRAYGSVNSYNNFFTKFFAWLFKWTVYVQIGNKERACNKWDYAQWLRERTGDETITVARVHEFVNFGSFGHLLAPPSEDSPPINQCLSYSKVARLGRKLIHALYTSNFEKAALCVLRGAELNNQFYIRGSYGISHYSQLEGIEARPVDLTIRKYSPLLLAADHLQTTLCSLMGRCGADSNFVGQELHFTRSVVDYESRSRLETNVGYALTRRNHLRPVVTLDHRHTTVVTLEDRKTHLTDLIFNNNAIVRRQVQNPLPEIRTFTVPISDYRYPLLYA